MGDPFTAIGISIGLNLVSSLFAPTIEQKAPEPNPRMPRSKFNDPIPLIYGQVRLGSNKFFPDDEETLYRIETKTKSRGGKGGGPRVKSEEKIVFGTFAASLCQGPVTLNRIYLNGREIGIGSEFYNKYIDFFDGTQTVPWSQMQASAPPPLDQVVYKGIAYLAFEDMKLSNDLFGGQIPQQIDAVVTDATFGANPTLQQVVGDLCSRAGLAPAEYDVSELAPLILRDGLIVNESGDGYRKVIEDLMQFYLFTAFEDGNGVIKFKTFDRGAVTPLVIPESSFLPCSQGAIKDQMFVRTTTPEQELPNKITMKFINREDHFENDEIVEYFEDFTKPVNINIDTRLTSYPDFIRSRARLILDFNYITQRNTYYFKIPMNFYEGNDLEPVELVQLPNGDVVQLHQVNPTNDYTLDCVAKLYYPQSNFSYSVTAPTDAGGTSIPDSVIPAVYVCDTTRIPNTSPWRFYIFAEAACVVEIATNANFENSSEVQHTRPSVIGTCQTILPQISQPDPNSSDTLDVLMEVGEVFDAPSPVFPFNPGQFSANTNLALVARQSSGGVWVGEFIQFGSVTDLGSNVYRLSDLSRGLHDSYSFSNHSAGAKLFVFRDAQNLAYYSSTEISIQGWGEYIYGVGNAPTYYYRAIVSDWQNLATTPVQSGQPQGNSYRPIAPTALAESQDSQGTVKITWEYADPYSQYTNGAENPSFEVDIIQGGVQRTIATTLKETFYTQTQRTADGVVFPFDVQVFAVSELVGRGDGSQILTVNEDLTPPDETFITGNFSNIRGIKYINGTTMLGVIVNYNVPAEEDRFEYVVQNATVDDYTDLTFSADLPTGFQAFITNDRNNSLGARIKIQVPSVSSIIDYVDVHRGGTCIVIHLGNGIYTIKGNHLLKYQTEGTEFTNVVKIINYKSSDSSITISGSGADLFEIDFTIGDLSETIDDRVAALVQEGTNMTITYDDGANTLTFDAAGLDTEAVQDVVGAMVIGGTDINATYNDGLGTLTLDYTGSAGLDQEQVEDIVANLLTAGTDIGIVYNDTLGTLTISYTGTAGLDTEGVQDVVGAMVIGGTDIDATYDDGAGTLTLDYTGTGGGTGTVAYSGATTDDIVSQVGTLANTDITTVFTATQAQQIRAIRFCNTAPATQDVRMWIRSSSVDYGFQTISLVQDDVIELTFKLLQLQNGDEIKLKATVSPLVYFLSYADRDEGVLVFGNASTTSLTNMYTCPASTSTNIKTIHLMNANASNAQDYTISINGNFFKKDNLAIGQSMYIDTEELLRISTGTTIDIQATEGNIQFTLEVVENAV